MHKCIEIKVNSLVMREYYLKFLNDMKLSTGLSLSKLAKKAGVADSTLTRFVKNSSQKNLSHQTLDKIAIIAGFDSYFDYCTGKKERNSPSYNNKESDYEIEDIIKLETFEIVKKVSKTRDTYLDSDKLKNLTLEVLAVAKKLNTNIITESLVTYIFERNNL